MTTQTASFDQPTVGSNNSDFFKPPEHPKQARIALIPGEYVKGDLIPSDEEKERAQNGDKAALARLHQCKELTDAIQAAGARKPPGVEKWTDPDTNEAKILFPRMEQAPTFWMQTPEIKGYILWKEGVPEEAMPKGKVMCYGLIIVEYETDDNMDVIPGKPMPLKIWTITDGKAQNWKKHATRFPLIANDYLVWTEKKGAATITDFSPAGGCAWREDPATMAEIMGKSRKMWEKVPKAVGRSYTVSEICKAAGVPVPAALAASEKAAEVQKHQNQEADFDNLVGG